MKKATPITPMPEWLKIAAPGAMFSAKDLYGLFGYKDPRSFLNVVWDGTHGAELKFPPPDRMPFGLYCQVRQVWSKKTVLKEYRRRLAENNFQKVLDK